MVSEQCKLHLKSELDNLELDFKNLYRGEVELSESLSAEQFRSLDGSLRNYGLELIVDKRTILTEKIKHLIIELVESEVELKVNLSNYLSDKLNYEYKYLSNLFSEINGSSIEQFIIDQKIKRVKELLVNNGENLSEIAWKLHYSSVQHLSYQFKKVTGITPTYFRKLSRKKLTETDDV